MAESLTLRELVERWRRLSKTLSVAESQMIQGMCVAYHISADELAATLTAMTCATCKHLAPFVVPQTLAGECNHPNFGGSEVPKDHFCKAHEVALVAPRADRDREE